MSLECRDRAWERSRLGCTGRRPAGDSRASLRCYFFERRKPPGEGTGPTITVCSSQMPFCKQKFDRLYAPLAAR